MNCRMIPAHTENAGPNQRTRNPNLEIRKGAINFASSETIPGSPLLLMQIFEESARFQLPLSAEAKRLVKEFQYLADETFHLFETGRQIV